jgi:hypothetical protein
MDRHEESACTATLLDLVFYEALRRNLSPETEGLLADHLRNCPSCRRRILLIQREVLAIGPRPNFG